jgi:hypothetical protein
VKTYVLGALGHVREHAWSSNGNQVLLELLGGNLSDGVGGLRGWLKRQEVGQKTSNVRRGHRSSRDGVGGILAADPGRLNVETWGEDVVALSEVGEVGTLIGNGGSTDSHGFLGSGWGVVAGVGVVVTGGNGEVDTGINGGINGEIQSSGLSTTKRHVGSRTLEWLLVLALLSSLDSLHVASGSPLDTFNYVGHGAGAIRLEHLYGVDIGLLGHTVLLTGNGTGAVSSVSVAVLVLITSRDGLAPGGTTLEVNVVHVGASVNDIDVNALASVRGIQVLVEGTEGQSLLVRDTGKTPGCAVLGRSVTHGVNERVLLDEGNLSMNMSADVFRVE